MSGLHGDSMMECPNHGHRKPAFVCCHLHRGSGLGFNQPEEPPDEELPFEHAWCDACEKVAVEQEGWNDVSEAHASITAVCEGCLEEIRTRNHRAT